MQGPCELCVPMRGGPHTLGDLEARSQRLCYQGDRGLDQQLGCEADPLLLGEVK